ncbi:uncharacterized protein LOC133310263 [Gastrolobium bilobum]|uniref:uncharacterized protein LOC133310263 n=1 Tax=Gastrolobium bilobum TaxID=150636 RepID=UPI002AB0E7CF|nr:uncharacterized protein LOC133310263 [Gastrolobium bilobum]
MEMEVGVATPVVDFNFDSNCSSPYMTAPSSPQRFANFFFSAPTSPNRSVSSFFNHFASSSSSSSSVPFHWEQKPGVPKSNALPDHNNNNDDDDNGNDFEFNFGAQLERASLSAEELFDGGKIRPLKPPPRLQSGDGTFSPATTASSPRSRISQGKKMVQEAFSPRHHQKRDFDPFEAAMEETRKREEQPQQQQQQKRGRERFSSSSSGRKGSRSLSPLRVSDIMCDSDDKGGVSSSTSNPKSSSSSFLSSIPFIKGYRKWRLGDFLLFRSASEGRATDKDPLRKYMVLSKKAAEDDLKNSSFRSTESSGSVSRRRGPVSAHELHYTLNRAASEEMKKKTFLPYKHGLLGCLGFNHSMHDISRGIGSLTRS